jgi:1-deoxyxylulose-5-phosphate synthase
MRYRELGRSGLLVSCLAVGTDNFANPTPEDESIAILNAAADGGVNLFDTSNSYAAGESERIIGRWLKQRGRRDDVFIATKCYYPTGPNPGDRGLSRRAVLKACDESLARLGVDYIDLYQSHRPDADVPLEETLGAFDELVRAGKVRYIGSTTAPGHLIAESVLTSRSLGLAQIVCEQTPYNLLDRRAEIEIVPAAQRHGLGVLTWSPLAMGMLAGRYRDVSAPPPDSRIAKRGGIYAERVAQPAADVGNAFAALAREAGYDPAQLATAWIADQPGVTAPLLGPRTLQQLLDALPVGNLPFPDELRDACDDLVAPGTNIANFFNSAPWMPQRRS